MKMTQAEAYKIIGNQPTYAVRNMVHALSMLTFLNTPDDETRLQAAKIWLRMGAKKRQEFFNARAQRVVNSTR